MTKTKSKIKLIIIFVLTAIGLFLTFASFVIPTTNTTFRGFFGAINYGYDINGGRLSVYEISNINSDDALVNGSEKLDNIVLRYQIYFSDIGLNVSRQKDNVRIEVSYFDNQNISQLMSKMGSSVDFFELIASQDGFVLSSASSFDEVTDDNSVDGSYVANCKTGTSQAYTDGKNYYPVTVEFDAEGQTKLKNLTQKIVSSDSKKIYMYVNGTNYISGGLDVSESMTSFSITSTSDAGARALRLQILALAKPLALTKIVDSTVSAGLNTSIFAFFGNAKTMLIVGLLCMLLATFVFFGARYRMLGLFASVAILIFVSVYAFLLQSIPLVLIDVNGLLGVLATYFICVSGMVEIFEKIREEYSLGKKIPNSVKSGFAKNMFKTLEKYAFVLIACVVLFLVGSSALKHFSIALFVGLFVDFFTIFVALRGMCGAYTVVNGTRKGAYNLKREVAEL